MTSKKLSQRDRLKNRKLPSVTQPIVIEDPTAADRALKYADRVHQHALRGGDADEIKRTKAAVGRAQKKFDACFEHLTIRALRPRDYDDLIEEHPPTEEQLAAATDPLDTPQWNRETFRPALLAACIEGDMTAEDWAEWLEESSSRGEGQKLFIVTLALNEAERLPESAMLPKGSRLTPSSP